MNKQRRKQIYELAEKIRELKDEVKRSATRSRTITTICPKVSKAARKATERKR